MSDFVRATNIAHQDPYSDDYDGECFTHAVTGLFTCPFPRCDADFKLELQLQRHLMITHALKDIRCPLCMKTFKTVASLVRHFEASEKGAHCKVSKLVNYQKALDEATGGFVSAQSVQPEKLVLESDGKKAGGVRSHKYTGELPDTAGIW